MRKVVVQELATLDGVIEDPGGETDFEHSGWQMDFIDEDQLTHVVARYKSAEALLLGRRTYEGFAAAWPSRTGLGGLADRINSMPKFVASRTLTDVEWNATLLDGDAVEAVAELRQQDGGDLLLVGSVSLLHALMRRDLIDTYEVWVHSLVLGSGTRLFEAAGEKIALSLVDVKTTGAGTAILTYERRR
jgi:dihydrofolate reductase